MISKVITYLFFGVLWNVILEIIAKVLESDNKLNNYEKVFSIVLWPITLIIFGYHFIKTFFKQ